jgi:SAM-dependent methyltransferase
MLGRLRAKVSDLELEDSIEVEERSFLELEGVSGGPFDAVFSDLGGLNCVRDLRPVVAGVRRVLRPGGVVVWVLMPRICLWELGMAFTGQFGLAVRRLRRGGTIAHLEGREFPVYYFSPRRAMESFGPDFELVGLEGLAVATPTAESKNLARRHPRIYGALDRLDRIMSKHSPFLGWGDFYILSMRYRPAETKAGDR